MPEIPRPVLEYIYERIIRDRSPAFLLLGPDGCLRDWAGSPEKYGIGDLEKGKPAEDYADVLSGFFPFDEEQTTLSCVRTGNGVYADIHILRKEKGYWVIFLDVSHEEEWQRVLQQKINDMTLLRDRYLKLMEQHLGKEGAGRLIQAGFREPEEIAASVLVADIRGRTQGAGRRAHEVFDLLNAYMTAVIQPVTDEGGWVAHIAGNRITALFGISASLPGIPSSVQAVSACFRIIAGICSLGENISELGIGVATGPVLWGITGSPERKALSIIGPGVGRAAFLGTEARLHEILIDRNTFLGIGELQGRFAKTRLRKKSAEGLSEAFSCV